MRDGLASGSDVCLGEEQTAQPDLDVVEVVQLSNLVELREAAREVGDPFRYTHRLVHLVAAPVRRDGAYGGFQFSRTENKKKAGLTLGERAHEGTQVICLLERALADLNDVRQVLPDLRQKLAADTAFAEEQAVQWVRMFSTLLLKRVEVL